MQMCRRNPVPLCSVLRGEDLYPSYIQLSKFQTPKVPLWYHCFFKTSLPEMKYLLRKKKKMLDSAAAGRAISEEFVAGTR